MAPKDPLAPNLPDISDFVRLPKRADARRNYESLLVSAAKHFAAHGLNTSLDDIARDAGVGNATLYRHFPTRQELIVAVSAREFESLSTRGSELIESQPPGEAAEEWLRYFLALIKSKRGLAAAMLDSPDELHSPDGDSSVVTSLFAYIETTASRLLDPAKAAGAFRSDLRPSDVVKLMTAVALATETDAPDEVDRVLALVVEGLRPASS